MHACIIIIISIITAKTKASTDSVCVYILIYLISANRSLLEFTYLIDFYSLFPPHRSVLEPLAQWDSPMQVKLSCWKSGLNTLLVELLPWALLVNHSKWDVWLFEGETIVLQIPAGKIIVPPNFKVLCLLQNMDPARKIVQINATE